MQNYLPYSLIQIKKPEGRKLLLDFCNKHNITGISSFSLYNNYFNTINLKKEEFNKIFAPNKDKILEKNIANIYKENSVSEYILPTLLNLEINIPLNEVLFNENVFAFHSETIEKAFYKGLIMEKYLAYKFRTKDKISVKNKTSKNFDEGKAETTVSFPNNFPIFDLVKNNVEKKIKGSLSCVRNKREPDDYKTFLLYDAEIIFIYNTGINNTINQVINRNTYNDIPIEKLQSYLRSLDLEDAYLYDLLTFTYLEAIRNKSKLDQNKREREEIFNFMSLTPKNGTLGNLAYKAFNQNFINNKYSSEYMNQYGYFLMLLHIGDNSFITLKLDPK